MRTFYLTNANVKQTANMVRTILKTRDIFVDEKLNLLVMRDTPKAIRLAEKLVASQDIAEPEVMLEVEVLEVAANRLSPGPALPRTRGLEPSAGRRQCRARSDGARVAQPHLGPRAPDRHRPAVRAQAAPAGRPHQPARQPAHPRKNKEKAHIHIGDRVPVMTTTAAVAGGFVSESVNYLDVGLKLESSR